MTTESTAAAKLDRPSRKDRRGRRPDPLTTDDKRGRANRLARRRTKRDAAARARRGNRG